MPIVIKYAILNLSQRVYNYMRKFYRSRRQLILKGFLYVMVFLAAFADGTLDGRLFANGNQSFQPDLPLAAVVKRWGLTSTRQTRYGPIELSGRAITLRFAPGLRFAMVNHRTITLSRAPVFKNGALVLPGELLRLLPSPIPRANPIESDMVVIIDPGHGGRDTGAIGYRGIKEKDITLKVGLYVRQYLNHRGIKVKMTRTRDIYPSLAARSDLANRTPNSIFISIHANAAPESNARGVETFVLTSRISDAYRSRKAAANYFPAYLRKGSYYRRQNEAVMRTVCKEARRESLTLARGIHRRLVQTTGDTDRGVKKDNLHVLRESYFSPAILVELGFLTNPHSARLLTQSHYQKQLARAIADGIADYLVERQKTKTTTAWHTLLSRPEARRWD